MDESKARAIELGEAAGEDAALGVYRHSGIDALANTLQPSPHERYAEAFYALWKGGAEGWQKMAFGRQLATKAGVGMVVIEGYPDPRNLRAFDQVFARGARRVAEMLVCGYLDGKAGKRAPWAPTRLGTRPKLIEAYETGYKLGATGADHG